MVVTNHKLLSMKTLKIAIFTLCVVAMISCNNRTTKSGDTLGTETATDSYDKTPADGTDTMETNDADNHTITQTSTLNTQDLTDLYSELNMTKEQIERFENDYRQMQSNRGSDNIVDSNYVDLQMDESLEKVLSTEQYAKYEKWKESHPRK